MGLRRRGKRRQPRRQIPPGRRTLYYVGMLLIAAGIVVFVSNFFLGPKVSSPDDPHLGDPDWAERVEEKHDAFERGMGEVMVRALVGMGLMVAGGIMMRIAVRGVAGSGLVLDPEQAREDVEPWTRMGGAMIGDALSEVDLAEKLGTRSEPAEPEVKVRCRKCRLLNDETAKFCNECGAAL